MRIIFQKIERVITSCPKREKIANANQCKKCDDGFEISGNLHCGYNDPVGMCVSSIGHALSDDEVFAVDLKPECGMGGGHTFCWPVVDGVIGESVYVSQSKGYYCKQENIK